MLRVKGEVLEPSLIPKALAKLNVVESDLLSEATQRNAEKDVDSNSRRSCNGHVVQGFIRRVVDMCATALVGNRLITSRSDRSEG